MPFIAHPRHNWHHGHNPLFAPISFHKERRRLWYAYRRVYGYGVLPKRYVGKSAGLTAERLEETAVLLNDIW